MKLFKKKEKAGKKEEPLQYSDGMMPSPPTVPTTGKEQLKHTSRRNLQPQQQQEPQLQHQSSSGDRFHLNTPSAPEPDRMRRYADHQNAQQQYDYGPPPQEYHQHQQYRQHSSGQRSSQRQVESPHAHSRKTEQQRGAAASAYPPQQAKAPPPPPPSDQHQHSSNTPRQSFEPTQVPPSKEKAPPPSPSSLQVDPVVQAERAAITRELVKQYVADIWNRGDLELIPKVCARGLRFNGSAGMDRVGHDGFQRMVETIRGSLEDYHCEIHSMVVEGNKAFCRMRFTGRHVGQLLGYEATGKHVSWMGASEFTVVDGLIVKVWELGDMSSLEHQLRQASASGAGGAH